MEHIILEGDTVTVEQLPVLRLVEEQKEYHDPRNSARKFSDKKETGERKAWPR